MIDFEKIKRMGEKTNRIIELNEQVKELRACAESLLEQEDGETKTLRLVVMQTSDKLMKIESGFQINPGPIGPRSITGVATHIKPVLLNINSDAQFLIIQGLIDALEDEQKDIERSLKKDSGNL